MIPAVIYARYSSTNQREESIEGQLRECHRYAERVGLSVIHEYTDSAISGTSDKRPAFQQMIRDSKKKAFEVVIVWKLDRFARNRYDAAVYRKKLADNGVRLVSAMETFSDGPEGIILEGLMEAMAEYYSANLSENVHRGLYDSAMQRKVFGQPVLGYKTGADGRYEIDPLTAPVVQRIFREYASGKSQKEIIDRLNAEGFRTVRGHPFTKNSIRGLLSNEKYTGMYRYKDIADPDGIPPIIEKELFDSVQKMVVVKKHQKKTSDGEPCYMLTTKLFCGECGRMMVGESARSKVGAIFRYYSCSGRRTKKKTCKKSRVKKDWIESEVIRIVTQEVLSDEFIDVVADGFMDQQKQSQSDLKIQDLKNQLKAVQKKLDNINRAIAEGIWSESTGSMLSEIEKQKANISDAIQAERLSAPAASVGRDEVVTILREMRDAAKCSENVAQALIDAFVFRIYLFDDDDKNRQRVVVEYSPTGYIDNAVRYEDMLIVRAEHVSPCFSGIARTLWTLGGSVFVEYLITKK